MERFKRALNYLKLSLMAEFTSPIIYAVFIILFLFIWSSFSGVTSWLSENNDSLNLFEFYTFFGCDFFTNTIYLTGIMFVSCGIFFFNSGSAYYLIRMDKRTWVNSQIIYMFVMTVIYNIALIVMFIIACGGKITFDGSWSKAAFVGCSGGAMQINIVDVISMLTPGLLTYNPNFIGIVSFFLLTVEGASAGLLMIWLTMKRKTVYAVAVIFGGQFLDMLAINEISSNTIVGKIWSYAVPFRMYRVNFSSLNNGKVSIIYSMIYITVILTVLILLIRRSAADIDFVKDE